MSRFGTVVVVGVGLIGGSVGLALRARSLASRVVGVGRTVEGLGEALKVGAIDATATDLATAVSGANVEVVVVCTPVTAIAEAVILAARHGRPDLLVTDAGSTKRTIVEAVERLPEARGAFVGAHPIAGSERKGASAADSALFDGRACVLTPTERTPPDRLVRAHAFWSAIGCRVAELSPAAHDQALALTSHLPHVVAAALAATVPVEALRFAAGAYRDATRVAASDPALWSDIFLENRAMVLDALSHYEGQLAAFRRALESGEDDALREWWDHARNRRLVFDVQHAQPALQD